MNDLRTKEKEKNLKIKVSLLSISLFIMGLAASDGFGNGADDSPFARKINAPLVNGGDVFQSGISPDGSRFVYIADQDTNEKRELYSVPVKGGPVTKISAPIMGGIGVGTFVISKDGTHVVYRATGANPSVYELFSAPIDGGEVKKLSSPLAGGAGIASFQVSNDNLHVVYQADQDIVGVKELYMASIDGGPVTKLNPSLAKGQSILSYAVSPDGARVVYISNLESADSYEIFSAPVTGGDSIKLNSALVPGGLVGSYLISPDSSRVVYQAQQDDPNSVDLYSVPITGGPSIKLNPAPSGERFSFMVWWDFVISPDSSRVIYRADQETPEIYELFSVPLAGGPSVRVSVPRTGAGLSLYRLSVVGFTPDSSRLLFVSDNDESIFAHLYSVPVSGGLVTRLSRPDAISVGAIDITSDGSRVVYSTRISSEFNAPSLLFVVPVTGGPSIQLNAPLVSGGSVGTFAISPDDEWVVYNADQDIDQVYELYRTPIGGGPVTKLNPTLVPGRRVGADGRGATGFSFTPDSKYVFYPGDQETDEVYELFMATLPVKTSVDIKPDECPNNVNLKSNGKLIVVISGRAGFDVTTINANSVRLAGVAPVKFRIEDITAPYSPFLGKSLATDCLIQAHDGFADLALQFETEELADKLGNTKNGEIVTIDLTGKLKVGGTIIGEDVIVIKK
jgi:Tol biopolymer transport system component